MNIAKIVGSNSHIDYIARVIDDLDVGNPPSSDDYGFATFVSVPLENDLTLIGVIYNSMLMNPDYANFGPRLSPAPELGSFSPDFINERGCLIGILLLGSIDGKGLISQGIPSRVIPAGQEVEKSDQETIANFHSDGERKLQIHYYSQVIAHAGNFAAPLLENIISRLREGCSEADEKRLSILRQNLTWQRTIGGMRL